MPRTNRALFLDRDGTLIFDKDHLSDPDGVDLIPGVRDALIRALEIGFRLFLHTNQSGIGRGWYSMEDVRLCNERMFELLALPEPAFTEVCIASESPDETAVYRKPSPRFIDEMVEKYQLERESCYMIGDRDSDLQAGINGRLRPVFVKTGAEMTEEIRALLQGYDVLVFGSLGEFVNSLEFDS